MMHGTVNIKCRSDIYVYFNVFFKLIKVLLLVSELYMNQNARFNDNKNHNPCYCWITNPGHTV